MRILLLLVIFLGILSCQTNEKIPDAEEGSLYIRQDTLEIVETTENKGIDATNKPKENLSDNKPNAQVHFTQGTKNIITFNTVSNVGVAYINGKEYSLNQLLFSEDSYIISGKGIEISAEGGDFDTNKTGCVVGSFSDVTVTIGENNFTIENIKVEDCSTN